MTNNKAPTIKSPCVLICSIDQNSGHCFGCGRTSKEITNWVNYTPMERELIMGELQTRLEALPKRRERRKTKRRGFNKTQ